MPTLECVSVTASDTIIAHEHTTTVTVNIVNNTDADYNVRWGVIIDGDLKDDQTVLVASGMEFENDMTVTDSYGTTGEKTVEAKILNEDIVTFFDI